MAKQLNPGDTFPNYTVPTTDGVALNIPADLKGEYAVVIFLPRHLVTVLRSAGSRFPISYR